MEEELLIPLDKIQALIVEKDPDDCDKFLRKIWNLVQEVKEIANQLP